MRLAECRYVGQGYELTVEVPPMPADESWLAAVREAFHAAHEQTYLRRFEDKPVMIVNVGLVGIGHVPPLRRARLAAGNARIDSTALIDERDVYFVAGNKAERQRTRFLARESLCAGNRIAGPAIIEQADTTTVLPPGTAAVVDTWGNLIVTFTESDDAG